MRKIVFVVAPHGVAGGGMGRVRDYIVESPAEWWGDLQPVPLTSRDVGGKLHSLMLVLHCCGAIWRSHRRGELALVHLNMGDRGSAFRKSVLLLFCKMIGVPAIVHLHAVELPKLGRQWRWMLAKALSQATAIIVLGRIFERLVRQTLGVTRPPVEILCNGVPIEPVASRRHDVVPGRPITIQFLGTLDERKGTSDLIAALAGLGQGGQGWRAVFAGGGDIETYRAKAEAAGIGQHVDFPGWVGQDDARRLLREADMLVLPSYDEGLPLVILEAIGLGTPVIATAVGATPEFLTDNEIKLCRPGDVCGLQDAIADLIDHPLLRQRLCDNGLKLFDELFSLRMFCQNLLDNWNAHRLKA